MASVLIRDRRGAVSSAEERAAGAGRGGQGVPRPQGPLAAPQAARGKDVPWSLSTECGPRDTLISDFYLPDLRENTFLLLWATQSRVLCYRSPRKLIQRG